MNRIRAIYKLILQFVLPNYCLSCKKQIAENKELFCFNCSDKFITSNHFKNQNNPLVKRLNKNDVHPQFAASLYLFNKETSIQKYIHLLKYNNKTIIGAYFGRKITYELNNCSIIDKIDFIVPVPLSNNKIKKRGYNQSEFIANEIAKVAKIKTDLSLIKRVKDTDSQTHKNAKARKENMKDVFKWTKSFNKPTHILLVDDVITTGATIWGIYNVKPKNVFIYIVSIGYTV